MCCYYLWPAMMIEFSSQFLIAERFLASLSVYDEGTIHGWLFGRWQHWACSLLAEFSLACTRWGK